MWELKAILLYMEQKHDRMFYVQLFIDLSGFIKDAETDQYIISFSDIDDLRLQIYGKNG
jgi:hypothetical protein